MVLVCYNNDVARVCAQALDTSFEFAVSDLFRATGERSRLSALSGPQRRRPEPHNRIGRKGCRFTESMAG